MNLIYLYVIIAVASAELEQFIRKGDVVISTRHIR